MPEPFRTQTMQTPVIPIVGEMIRQTPGTISLGQGVVYYPPPPQALETLAQGLADPENHKYKPVQGIPPLLEVLERKLRVENRLEIAEPDGLLVTAGGNMAFVNALLAVTDPGDEVILQTPFYFNHEMAIAMAGCRPVCVETDSNYQLRLDALAAAITPRTRAIVTISPNNPTGAVYPPADLQAVNTLCAQQGLYHIHDEAYEYFLYEDLSPFSPGSLSGSSSHTLSLFSLSKSYGFASWRIGYMTLPAHLVVAVKKIQDTVQICPPVVSQYAALGALGVGADYCRERVRGMAKVRQQAQAAFAEIADLCTIPPAQGAFYFFIKVATSLDSMTLVERLIREHRVAVMPGVAFGKEQECYLRVSYGALQPETVTEGIGRLVQGLRTILTAH